MKIHCLLLSALLLVGACATGSDDSRSQSAQQLNPLGQRILEMMAYFLEGTFDTIEQPAGYGDSTPVRMHLKRIWPESKGEIWFYQELARRDDLEHPFRQRLIRYRDASPEIHADVFLVPEPASRVGEWRKERPFAALDPRMLKEDRRCGETWQKQHEALFAGGSSTKECPTSIAGAYEHLDYYMSSSSIRYWGRDLNAAGTQVGGPSGPWEFRKIAR